MASPEDIVQKILLRLEEEVNAGAVSKHLKEVNKSLIKTQKSIKASTKSMSKFGAVAGKSVRGIAVGLKGLMSALTGVVGLLNKLADAGKSFITVSIATGRGSKAAKDLKSEYEELRKTTDHLVLSIHDVANAMSDFASLGFGQMFLSENKKVREGISQMQNMFTRATGDPEKGRKFTQAILASFGNNLAALESFTTKVGLAGGDIQKQLDLFSKRMGATDPALILELTAALELLTGKTDANLELTRTWYEVLGELKAVADNVTVALVDAFGGKITTYLKKFVAWIKDLSGETTNLSNRFREWATYIYALEVPFQGFWDLVKRVYNKIIEKGKELWAKLRKGGYSAMSDLTLRMKEWLKDYFSDLDGFFKKLGVEFFTGVDVDGLIDKLDKSSEDFKRTADAITFKAASPNLDLEGDFKKRYGAYIKKVEELQKAEKDRQKQAVTDAKKVADAIKKGNTNIKSTSDLLFEARKRLAFLNEQAKGWAQQMQSVGQAVDTISKLTRLVGSDFSGLANLSGKNTEAIRESVKLSQRLFENSQARLLISEQSIAARREELRLSSKQGEAEAQEALTRALAERAEIQGDMLNAVQQQVASLDAALQPAEAHLDIIKAQTDLYQTQLSIAKGLYGAAGLAVQNQMRVVEQLQLQKDNLDGQIQTYKEQVAYMDSIGAEASKIKVVQVKLLELENRRAKVLSQQVQMVKELRDGYLDAVQAQAFGAGRFEKIIITQEKNIAKALEKNIAKRNFLLGATGAEAGAGRAVSRRYSGAGLGVLTGPGGGAVGPGDVRRNMNEIKKGLRPETRAVLDEVQRSYGDSVNTLNETNQQQLESQKKNIVSLDKNTSALDKMFNRKAGRAGGVAGLAGGGPAAEVEFGQRTQKALANQQQTATNRMKQLFGGLWKQVFGGTGGRAGGGGGGGGGSVQGLLKAFDYATIGPGKRAPARVSRTQRELAKIESKLSALRTNAGDEGIVDGINISGANKQGFDTRTGKQIGRQRDKRRKEIERLQKQRKRITGRLGRAGKKPTGTGGGGTGGSGGGFVDEWIKGLFDPSSSVDLSTVAGNQGGGGRKLVLGKSKGGDWTSMMQTVIEIFKNLGPLLDELAAQDRGGVEVQKQTGVGGKAGVNTSLSGGK